MTEEAKMNGPAEGGRFIDSLDIDDPEYIRQKNRPAEVKEDVKQMDARRRVNQILTSQAFRDELERIVSEQMQAGTGPISANALQQISELLLPQHRFSQGGFFSKASGAVIPIADIKGVDSLNYERGEKILRNKVASCYRLLDIFGWSNFFSNLISCRITQNTEHFLIAPHGMMAHEVTASSLIKVDMQGHVLDPGSSTLLANTPLFLVLAALHAFRPDIKCLMLLRCSQALALSSLKDGIVLLTPEAASLGQVSYAEFIGLTDGYGYLAEQLGPLNKVLVLRNFGVIIGGESIEEAFLNARYLMSASDTQLALMSLGSDHLLTPSDEAMAKAAQLTSFIPTREDGKKKWRRGELEFDALMRHLDNAGFRTNHLYRDPQFKRTLKPERSNSEVEIPPATVSFTYDDEGRLLSPLRLHEMQRKAHKTDWLNTPNKYTKEEMDEIGTATPKKITKWVPESGGKVGQPFKIESPNQFAPQGANPKELKLKHQEIRREYYEDKIDAGPQSKILEGVTWDEASQKNKQSGNTSDSVVVVGAASKGIIQKDHRHNVQMYKSTFTSNPFDTMTEEEIVRYKEDVTHSGKPDEDGLEPGPDGKLISTEERMQQVRQAQQESTPQEAPQSPADDPANRPAGPGVSVLATVTMDKTPKLQTLEAPLNRSASARGTEKVLNTPKKSQSDEKGLHGRSKSERKPKKGKDTNGEQLLGSPAKSMSSGEGTLDERSSREGSPSKEAQAEASTAEKEKKKKKFRMPSFSKQKKDKKAAK